MLALKRNRAPADPVAPVIYVGEDIIVTEPIALMRQLAITGQPRDDAWLAAFLDHAHQLVPGDFTEGYVHPVSECFRLDADRYHIHLSR